MFSLPFSNRLQRQHDLAVCVQAALLDDDVGEGLAGLLNDEVQRICDHFNEQLAALVRGSS